MATKRKAVVMSAEAVAAAKRKGPSVARLIQIMNGNMICHEPESWEGRWLAARWLEALGYDLQRETR